MPITNFLKRTASLSHLLLLSAGLAVGYAAGLGGGPTRFAQADVTETPRREAFQAGSVLNEPTLKEIAATLKRIEAKMERFQRSMPEAAAPARKATLPAAKR